ncbi:MAG TPA: dihydrofolate reductase family protein [Paracoccaceae bacterium]|nr:dihydrofolate reductase family protein [Paracoccaceae bacterium]
MMAASLDGFAADASGGVGWLAPFDAVNWGYDAFLTEIGTVVMGRTTFEDALHLSQDWPYPGKRAIVVSRTLPDRPGGGPGGDVEVWRDGVPALVPRLRALADGDVWIVGGPRLQGEMIALGALDRMQLAVTPVLLGRGKPVFPPSVAPPRQPRLQSAEPIGGGLAMLDYSFEG